MSQLAWAQRARLSRDCDRLFGHVWSMLLTVSEHGDAKYSAFYLPARAVQFRRRLPGETEDLQSHDAH